MNLRKVPHFGLAVAVVVTGLTVPVLTTSPAAAVPGPPAAGAQGTAAVPGTAAVQGTAAAPTRRVPRPRNIDGRARHETSGIVVSRRHPDLAFVLDDARGLGWLGVIRTDGSWVGKLRVRGLDPRNGEALAGGVCSASSSHSCLYVGDIGQNKPRRDVTVWRIHEPRLDRFVRLDRPGRRPAKRPMRSAAWRYTYPDGHHDAEAMMVDADGRILIVTKRRTGRQQEAEARVYVGEPGGGRLRYVSMLHLPSAGKASPQLRDRLVTDASSVPGQVLILTYGQVVRFTAPSRSAPLTSFPGWRRQSYQLRSFAQAEAISFLDRRAARPCSFVVAGEGSPGRPGQIAVRRCS